VGEGRRDDVIEVVLEDTISEVRFEFESSCLADFSTETVERVGAGVAGEELHLVVEDPGELIVHGVGERGVRDSAVVLHEPHLDILQVEKGDPPSEGVVGHAEEGDAGLVAEDVEDVAVLREAEAGVGVGRQLLEDAAGDGAGVARDGGELGQHDGAARHQRVHDRHGDGDRRDLIRWIWIWIP